MGGFGSEFSVSHQQSPRSRLVQVADLMVAMRRTVVLRPTKPVNIDWLRLCDWSDSQGSMGGPWKPLWLQERQEQRKRSLLRVEQEQQQGAVQQDASPSPRLSTGFFGTVPRTQTTDGGAPDAV